MNSHRLANKPIYITPSLHDILKAEARQLGMTLQGLAEKRLSKSVSRKKNGAQK